MSTIKQGEKLMLLVRRDDRSTDTIADAMDIDKSYLPKLYKMEKLPRKPLQKALSVFQLDDNYFDDPGGVSEPALRYGLPEKHKSELDVLQTELVNLRGEVARLREALAHEKTTSAQLVEALVNLSKK